LLDRFVKALLAREQHAKKPAALRVMPIDADGLPAFFDDRLVLLLHEQGTRPTQQNALTGIGFLLLPQGVRLAVFLDCFVKALLRGANLAKAVVSVRELRIDVDRLLVLLGGLLVLLLLAEAPAFVT